MRIILIIFFSSLILGCYQEPKPKKPGNLIPRDEMADILYDVYVLNSAKGINKKLLEVNGVSPEEYVFNKYRIDSVQFAQSNDYYAFNTEEYQVIIDSVKNRIDRQIIDFQVIKDSQDLERKRVRDSLNEIYKRERDSGIINTRRKPKKLLDSISIIQD